jgi:phosphoribosylglycinamide formyltransferase 1
MVKKNACVFISGFGSNLKSLIIKSREYNFPATIKLVICNNPNAKGIVHAKKNAIPYLIINTNKRNYQDKILRKLKEYKISLICLAGYMKIIPEKLIKEFKKKIINIHPSLLPKYKGLNTFKRIIENNERKTGCTIHYVNKKLDSGQIIIKKSFFIEENDNLEILKYKTQILEYKAFSEAIINMYRYN